MFKNQYAISYQKVTNIKIPKQIEWCALNVYLGTDTTFCVNNKCLIIGKAVHSLYPEKLLDTIVNDLANFETYQEALNYLDDVTGRYIVLLSINEDIYITTDACGFKRGLFFKNENFKFLTSSERFSEYLFGVDILIPHDVQEVIKDKSLQSKEYPWYGMGSYDRRFKYIIPNHFLVWSNLSLHRMPVPDIEEESVDDKILSAAQMIRNAIIGLSNQYTLIQPITAGYDSRMLLAASEPVKNKVRYYVFTNNNEHEDVRVAVKLSSKNNNSLSVVHPANKLDDCALIDILKANVLIPRLLPKTNNILYHLSFTPKECLNINGNGSEIARMVYGSSNLKLSPKSLAIIQGVEGWPVLLKGIEEWYNETDVQSFASANKLSISDLFYWEQRMPTWGALFPLEQDIAIDEVSPFSNRKLLYTLLRIPEPMRSRPNNIVSKAIVEILQPELNSIAYNPDSYGSIKGRIRINIKKNPLTIILARKIMSMKSKYN